MTIQRTTSVIGRVVSDGTPQARATSVIGRVVSDGTPKARVTSLSVRVVSTVEEVPPPPAGVPQVFLCL